MEAGVSAPVSLACRHQSAISGRFRLRFEAPGRRERERELELEPVLEKGGICHPEGRYRVQR